MKVAPLAKWPAAVGLVTGTILLTRSAPTTFAADKPVHSTIVTLGICGIIILALSRILSREGHVLEGRKDVAYEAVPLREVRRSSDDGSERERSGDERFLPDHHSTHPSSLRTLRVCFVVLVLALCLRAEVLHRVIKNVQCSTRSWTPLLPLAFAVEEWWRARRRWGRGVRGGDQNSAATGIDDEEASVYEALVTSIARMSGSKMVSVAMAVLGGIMAVGTTSPPHSTYICAVTLPYRLQIPHLQLVGWVLDVVIVWTTAQLVTLNASSRSLAGRAVAVGYAALLSSLMLFIAGIVYYFLEEADRTWIRTIYPVYFWGLLRLDSYIIVTLLCALALILHVGVLTTSLLATFTSLVTISTVSAWNSAHPFPPTHLGLGLLSLSMAMLGLVVYFSLDLTSKHSTPLFQRGMPIWLHLVLLTILLVWTSLFFATSTSVNYHPIDMLIYQAHARHETFLAHASTSKTLSRAAQVYKHRYQRHPPPGFDRWYDYAISRNSIIIDDFDSIHDDLLPFFALPPSVIRERTWELISNPWNDAAGLSIRQGKVSVMDNGIPGTHAWMLEGLVEMIGKFAEHLPDMDLAFNLNDECRVTVPYNSIQDLKAVAASQLSPLEDTPPQQNNFSPDRAEGWRPLPEEQNHETSLQEHSWQKIFENYGAVGCPSSSPAGTLRAWDTSTLCTTCMSPHSLGIFLSNWTLAADVCHQPDLADLHGIYLSPAAFKATNSLYPFFSQSKVSGFNDILYPSSWNYLEKAVYAPTEEHSDVPWSEKEDVLFWRGATSEGVSQGWAQWKGMVRQRFVNLLSSTSTIPSINLLPVGRPIPPNTTDFDGNPIHNKLGYTFTSTSPATDVHVVDTIVRCFGPDCTDQAAALAPLVPGIDFQEHWKYKFLLDLDGAAFSGRFLPFLRSGSLPFKAGLFREWWDNRVEAWKHFIPLDIRGVGAKATLSFFAAGDEGKRKGGRIASEGKEWAEQVLRKEDMEIYMFRLLLEWGRLVDDQRDNLGYNGV